MILFIVRNYLPCGTVTHSKSLEHSQKIGLSNSSAFVKRVDDYVRSDVSVPKIMLTLTLTLSLPN